MNADFSNLKTGFSFYRIEKIIEFHGKYEITVKRAGEDKPFILTFDESDISHR